MPDKATTIYCPESSTDTNGKQKLISMSRPFQHLAPTFLAIFLLPLLPVIYSSTHLFMLWAEWSIYCSPQCKGCNPVDHNFVSAVPYVSLIFLSPEVWQLVQLPASLNWGLLSWIFFKPRLASNTPDSWKWPWTDPPVSAPPTPVLGLQSHDTTWSKFCEC